MILFEILGTEKNQVYQDLSIDNLERQYDLLRSLVKAALAIERPMVSTAIIKALNAHAISCLHVNAGEYRPCPVQVGDYVPPDHYRIPELMNEFVNRVNYAWNNNDPIVLGTYVLWSINHIHPFINGNGRTARALCYYVISARSGGEPKGSPILPELVKQNHAEYVKLLKETDARAKAQRADLLAPMHEFLSRLVDQQLASAEEDSSGDEPPADG